MSDSRSCRSAPSCFDCGFDGGKKINGVKVHLGVEKHGIPLAIDVSPANTHDTKGIVPVLRELAGKGFQGSALGDLGYRGKRLAKAGQALGITVEAVAAAWAAGEVKRPVVSCVRMKSRTLGRICSRQRRPLKMP